MIEIISIIFKETLYRPLFNLLVFLYNVVPGHDFGLAIILVTVFIKFLLYPSSQKAIKSQKELTALQPKIKEVQEKYKDNREKQGLALIALYKEHKINPLSGFLPLLIQLPILIALYKVFLAGLDPERLNGLYSFVGNPGLIDPMFLGIIDLSKSSIVLALMAGFFQFIQSRMLLPKYKKKNQASNDFGSLLSQQMVYMMPLFTIFIAAKFPAGLALYWVVITLFSVIQQYFVFKKTVNEPLPQTLKKNEVQA